MTQPLTDAERERLRDLAHDALAYPDHVQIADVARAVLALDAEVGRLRGQDEKQSGALDLESFEREAARARRHWGHSTINDAYAEDVRTLCREVRRLRARVAALEAEVARLRDANAEEYARGYLDEGRNWKQALDRATARAEAAEARVRELREREEWLEDELTARVAELEAEVAWLKRFEPQPVIDDLDERVGAWASAEHELRARAERLERAVREAPHETTCREGKTDAFAPAGHKCDCWKAKALEGRD